MTDRKQALQDLLAKVEAGEYDAKFNGFCDQWEKCFPVGSYSDGWQAYKGSLDAAKALHEAVLPGEWVWTFKHADNCSLYKSDLTEWASAACIGNPARAWLTAILKALIAQGGEA